MLTRTHGPAIQEFYSHRNQLARLLESRLDANIFHGAAALLTDVDEDGNLTFMPADPERETAARRITTTVLRGLQGAKP